MVMTLSKPSAVPFRRIPLGLAGPEDPVEDENLVRDPQSAGVVDEIMDAHVRPFFTTPAYRPHASPLAG